MFKHATFTTLTECTIEMMQQNLLALSTFWCWILEVSIISREMIDKVDIMLSDEVNHGSQNLRKLTVWKLRKWMKIDVNICHLSFSAKIFYDRINYSLLFVS